MTALMYAMIVVYVIITIAAFVMMFAAMSIAGGELKFLLLAPAWPVYLGYFGGRYVYRYATDYDGQMKLLAQQSDERHEQAVKESEAKLPAQLPPQVIVVPSPTPADAAAREKAIAPALAITVTPAVQPVAAVPATAVAK